MSTVQQLSGSEEAVESSPSSAFPACKLSVLPHPPHPKGGFCGATTFGMSWSSQRGSCARADPPGSQRGPGKGFILSSKLEKGWDVQISLFLGKECRTLIEIPAEINPAGSALEGVLDVLSGSWDLCGDGGPGPATVPENQNQEQSSDWDGRESTGKDLG